MGAEAFARKHQERDGMGLRKSGEIYGLAKIHITRNCVGINGECWSAGDVIEGCPVNVACLMVNDKRAIFDRSEFTGEHEIENLEKLGYTVEPPMQRVRDKKEFQDVIARKRKGFVSETLDPARKKP